MLFDHWRDLFHGFDRSPDVRLTDSVLAQAMWSTFRMHRKHSVVTVVYRESRGAPYIVELPSVWSFGLSALSDAVLSASQSMCRLLITVTSCQQQRHPPTRWRWCEAPGTQSGSSESLAFTLVGLSTCTWWRSCGRSAIERPAGWWVGLADGWPVGWWNFHCKSTDYPSRRWKITWLSLTETCRTKLEKIEGLHRCPMCWGHYLCECTYVWWLCQCLLWSCDALICCALLIRPKSHAFHKSLNK